MLKRCALALTLLAAACATNQDGGRLREIPKGLVHVVFTGIDQAPREDLSWREALRLQERAREELKRTAREEGHVAWFFHAFDEEDLVFILARWHAGQLGGTYEALARYTVPRTRRGEQELGVADEIAEYERGVGKVHAGMSLAEVEAVRGKPDRRVELGPFGAFDILYPDLCVRFLEGRAAHLWSPERCQP
ncbi:hypothetical protein [Nannocystis punicea]|uniref:Lipoprotein n=1 Tax=Nannocystis punicea TaxID=2995304 RepID=A0ABY7H2X4_9BACT|nr:hypothetical protein [Nannocystis poenicansa]WAS93615.1 hypothetical protein O0S08_46380 [Nannocystis poenicansa]